MKVVVNKCYGGFGLSDKAREFIGLSPEDNKNDLQRHDPRLVAAVEQLGKEADGFCTKLEIIEIPDDVEYVIEDYDGMESVHEQHRTWW